MSCLFLLGMLSYRNIDFKISMQMRAKNLHYKFKLYESILRALLPAKVASRHLRPDICVPRFPSNEFTTQVISVRMPKENIYGNCNID
jgi:hypothetical protein